MGFVAVRVRLGVGLWPRREVPRGGAGRPSAPPVPWCFPGVFLVFSWRFPGVFLVFSCQECSSCVFLMFSYPDEHINLSTRPLRLNGQSHADS